MQVLRYRLPVSAPLWVSLALSGLIVLELQHAFWSLRSGVSRAAVAFTRGPPGVAAARANRSSPANVDTIVAAHLFGVLARTGKERDADAPPSTSQLRLLGTIATDRPETGMAIIASEDPGRVFRIGDTVDGAALHEVYATHVILDRDGELETLSLPRFQTPQGLAATVHDWTAPVALKGKMGDFVRAEPFIDDDSGALLGFRLRPGTSAAPFTRSGLRPGDLMTAVNGTTLAGQDPQRSSELVDAMLAASSAIISVLRNGKTADFTLDLAK